MGNTSIVNELIIILTLLFLQNSKSSTTVIPVNYLEISNRDCNSGSKASVGRLLEDILTAKNHGYTWIWQPECGPGHWFEVANIDMKNASHSCPYPFQYNNTSKICISTNCSSSLTFDVPSYKKICGRVTGQAFGSVDAFKIMQEGNRTLDQTFVDGLSIMHGNPRKHIWSFAAGHDGPTYRCPCDNQYRSIAVLPPSFVGNNYFCDGSYNGALWDGQNCTTACCTFHSPPWFKVDLPTVSTDSIEVRLCTDQDINNELVGIQQLQLYVQ